MKHTNRFLTAIALLLAALLISGLALAAEEPAEETETSPIKSIELKLAETEIVLNMDESTRSIFAFTWESSDRILITPEKEGTQPEYELLRFVSSNEKVATSGKNLYAKFAYFDYIGVGETEVRVQALSAAGKVLAESNAVKVTVKECPVEEMIVDPLKEKLASLSLHSDDFDLHDYVTIFPSGATYSDFTWSIADPSIVRVDKEGNLYALKLGETTITITSEGKDKDGKQLSAVIPVKVVAEPVTKITINPDTFTLVEGGKHLWLDEYITVEPEGQAAKDYSFLTSDRDVATVDPNALGIEVTPQGAGEATITVTALNYDGSTVSAEAKIIVEDASKKIESLKFPKEEYKITYAQGAVNSLNLREKIIISPRYDYHDDVELEWESSDINVAIVNDGTVSFVRPGSVTVTAKLAENDKVAPVSVKVTAEKIAIKKVSLNRTALSYVPGRYTYSQAVQMTVEPATAYIDADSVVVTSSDPEVATAAISGFSGGKATLSVNTFEYNDPKKAGTATITVSLSDGEKTYETAFTVTIEKKNPKLAFDKKNLTLYLKKNASANKNVVDLDVVDVGSYWSDFDSVAITWKSSNKKVATVDYRGRITLKGPGRTTITATTKDGTNVSASTRIIVKQELIKKINGTRKITMRVGEEDNAYDYLTFSPDYDHLYSTKLRFTTSDKNIVGVNANGTLAANAVGTAKITVEARDGSGVKFSFKVRVIEEKKAK